MIVNSRRNALEPWIAARDAAVFLLYGLHALEALDLIPDDFNRGAAQPAHRKQATDPPRAAAHRGAGAVEEMSVSLSACSVRQPLTAVLRRQAGRRLWQPATEDAGIAGLPETATPHLTS